MTHPPPEPPDVFNARCANMHEVIEKTRETVTSACLAELCQEPGDWAGRIYPPLEQMEPRDLALMIALLVYPQAEVDARRMWSELWTARPEDVPST